MTTSKNGTHLKSSPGKRERALKPSFDLVEKLYASTMSPHHSMTILFGAVVLSLATACSGERNRLATQNSLSQNTGEPGSTMSRTSPPYYPNSAGNIVAPPGNPAGNRAGDPPIVGGNVNQSGGWPEGR